MALEALQRIWWLLCGCVCWASAAASLSLRVSVGLSDPAGGALVTQLGLPLSLQERRGLRAGGRSEGDTEKEALSPEDTPLSRLGGGMVAGPGTTREAS